MRHMKHMVREYNLPYCTLSASLSQSRYLSRRTVGLRKTLQRVSALCSSPIRPIRGNGLVYNLQDGYFVILLSFVRTINLPSHII